MPTSTNINEMNAAQLDRYVIQLCDSIKTAIENKGIVVGSQAVEQYASLIAQITGVLQAKTVAPSTSQQVIEPDNNYDGLSSVTVQAVTNDIDQNILPANIKKDVEILGVVGTLETGGQAVLQTKSVTPSTSSQSIIADNGYDGLERVNIAAVDSSIDNNIVAGNIRDGVEILGVEGTYEGEAPDTESITVTPTTSSQTILPTTGYLIDEVDVRAVDSDIDSNIVAGNIRNGVEILGVTGTYTGSGGGANLQSKTITPTTSTITHFPDPGYDGFSDVTISEVTSAIDSNIVAGNIRDGIEILGVEGTYTGEGGGGDDPSVFGINTAPTSMQAAFSRNNHSNLLGVTDDLCYALDTSDVSTFRDCFYQNTEIINVDLQLWSFSSSTTEQNMFNGCTNLETITFDDNVSLHNAASMFNNCSSLVTIYGSINLNSCSGLSSMFAGCRSLQDLVISGFDYNSNQTLDLSASAVLDLETLIDNLPNKTVSRTKTIKVNSAVYTSALADAASAKGYTLST